MVNWDQILVFISFFVFTFNFEGNNYVNGGLTISKFKYAENAEPLTGYTIGIERDLHIYKPAYLSFGLNYNTRGALLKHRAIAAYATFPMPSYYWDIYAKIGYIEIPLYLRFKIPERSKFSLNLFFGISLAYPWKDLTKFKQKEFIEIIELPDYDYSKYDYTFEQESTFGDNQKRFIYPIGVQVQYQRVAIRFLYIIDNTKIYYHDSIYGFPFKMNTFNVIMSFRFL